MNLIPYLKDFRISFLLSLIVILAVLDLLFGGPNILHLGVEFVGGTQIPIQLVHSVDPGTMSTLINTLQSRLSTFGLKQVPVEGVGTSLVYVTLPSDESPAEIQSTLAIIESQGIFQGIVNGKEALNGASLISGSIGAAPLQSVGGNVTWQVSFLVSQQGAQKFAKVVFGQANKPLYMFLDRPNSSVVIINTSLLFQKQLPGINESALIQAMDTATSFGNKTIPVLTYSSNNTAQALSFLSSNKGKYSKVIISNNAPTQIIANATRLNYSIVYVSQQNITPEFISIIGSGGGRTPIVGSWPGIGLLSAPLLSPGVTNGSTEQNYLISGSAPQGLNTQAKISYAQNQTEKIVSILKGGALPVPVIVGSPTTIPATLGRHFEIISAVALLAAVVAVLAVMEIRYRKWFLILPIMFTTLAELFIIISIIGLVGNIDLAAVAGMIAVIGTGVDAQIIVTDELLGKTAEHTQKIRLGNAFYIIWVDAFLLIVAMTPLFFSSTLTQIIGFATSTMLGVFFGAFVTRPAYGSMISKHFSAESEK